MSGRPDVPLSVCLCGPLHECVWVEALCVCVCVCVGVVYGELCVCLCVSGCVYVCVYVRISELSFSYVGMHCRLQEQCKGSDLR